MAEYIAKLQTWLLTPVAYRGKEAPAIEAITGSGGRGWIKVWLGL